LYRDIQITGVALNSVKPNFISKYATLDKQFPVFWVVKQRSMEIVTTMRRVNLTKAAKTRKEKPTSASELKI
jgi:hypothetical protein